VGDRSHQLVVVVVVEERRRREHAVAIVDQLRHEALLVVVEPGRLRRDLGGGGGGGGRLFGGAAAAGAGKRSRLRLGLQAGPVAVVVDDVGHGAAGAGVLGRVGVAAGELLHERAESLRAGGHPHRVADVHYLDLLLPARAAAALALALTARAGAGRRAAVGIAALRRVPPSIHQ
jgi:hypothetical protein